MHCARCGREIADGSAFCPACGAAQRKTDRREGNTPYNTMCIIGAALSGLSLFLSFAGLAGIGGVVLSQRGLKQAEAAGEKGKKLAMAGIVVGVITAVLGINALLVSVHIMPDLFDLFSRI